jgi:hypothetical protein
MAQMEHIFAAWGVILSLMLVLRHRERIAREIVMAYRHCGEVGWGYHRASYWPKGE